MRVREIHKIVNRPRLIVMNVDDFEQLKHHDEQGECWTLKEFKENLNIPKGLGWIREFLLKPNREDIEVNGSKGWCVFGEGRGKSYIIKPSGARKWLEENFNKIDWDEK